MRKASRGVEAGPFVSAVGFGETAQLVLRMLAAAGAAGVHDIEEKEKIELAIFEQHVVGAADGVTAVDENKLLDFSFHAGFEQRFAKAADVWMSDLVGKLEVIRHVV